MTAPAERFFLDTNLLVYSYDRSEPARRRRAREVLARLAEAEAGVVSAIEQLACHLRLWKVVDVTGILVAEAAAAAHKHRLNYRDAQVWAAAHLNRIPAVLSEDFSHGAEIGGVRFWNPFVEAFR